MLKTHRDGQQEMGGNCWTNIARCACDARVLTLRHVEQIHLVEDLTLNGLTMDEQLIGPRTDGNITSALGLPKTVPEYDTTA